MDKKNIELRSEQIQEILTAVPNWMIRYGNTLVFLLIVGVLLMSYFIKYPDTISAEALITTEIPIQKLYANTDGRLDKIYFDNDDIVNNDDIIAVMENNASTSDIIYLESVLDTISVQKNDFKFPIEKIPVLFLGRIENDYDVFENAYLEYKNGPASESKANLRKTVLLFKKLNSAIDEWTELHLFKAGLKGTLSVMGSEKNNKEIKKGDLVFQVLPQGNSSFVAKLRIPAKHIGEIKKGQKVLVKPNSFNEEEYGVLEGKISKILFVPNDENFYQVNVVFKNHGLKTSYGKKLEFKYEINANAEIITEDLRLIERFFYQLKNVFSN